MAFLVDDVPLTEALCRSEFLTAGEVVGTFEPCYLVGVTSIPGYVPMFQALFECGGLYHRLPLHAFCAEPCAPLPLSALCLWDAFSYDVSVHAYQHLDGLRATVRCGDGETRLGRYRFTLDWADVSAQSAYAEIADQHKCAHILALDSGHLAAMPNNRVLFRESSWIHPKVPTHWRVQPRYYSVEGDRSVAAADGGLWAYSLEGERPPGQPAHKRSPPHGVQTTGWGDP